MTSFAAGYRVFTFNRLVRVLIVAAVLGGLVAWAAHGQAAPILSPNVPLPRGTLTDCGIDGSPYTLHQEVETGGGGRPASVIGNPPLSGPELERLRWGPCSGLANDRCRDNSKRCILEEPESGWLDEAAAIAVHGCNPGPHPAPVHLNGQWKEDVGKATGGLALRWLCQMQASCGVVTPVCAGGSRPTPRPSPTPSPTATPPVSAPTPQPAASPEPTAAPTVTPAPVCPPERPCPVAPRYTPRALSPRVHQAAALARSLRGLARIGPAARALLAELADAAEEAGLYRQEPSTAGTLTTTDPVEAP